VSTETVIVLGALLLGCSTPPTLTAGACDEREIARFTVECRVEIEATCGPAPSACPAEDHCNAELCRACPKAVGCRP
jgi:hypothetical protein